ncbi:MAG TPA: hypothetical protein VEB40_15970 [Flavipsychrobacter sp.]|nr:hypothetical protein [Flavipsychrobacter sp.]
MVRCQLRKKIVFSKNQGKGDITVALFCFYMGMQACARCVLACAMFVQTCAGCVPICAMTVQRSAILIFLYVSQQQGFWPMERWRGNKEHVSMSRKRKTAGLKVKLRNEGWQKSSALFFVGKFFAKMFQKV